MLWRHLNGELELGPRPLLMGILNVTPDSFSDGGKYLLEEKALAQALALVQAGADILDVGGESTRPGALPVSEEEEARRILPVIRLLKQAHPKVVLSVDTYKTNVAAQALEAGAAIVNDVGAGLWDGDMIGLIAQTGAGYVCMHSQGRPQDMQKNPGYYDVVAEVLEFLKERKEVLIKAGVSEQQLVFDVGIGFGKRPEDNLELLRRPEDWSGLSRPMLWGLSGKSFISKVLGVPPHQCQAGGLAAHAYLLKQAFPQIWRVHDVGSHAQLIGMWSRLQGG